MSPALLRWSCAYLRQAVLVLLLAVWGAAPTLAQNAEQQLKTAFLYHFCSYIQWPDRATTGKRASVVIGVVGARKTVMSIAEALEGRFHGTCEFSVRGIDPGDELGDIQILYVTRGFSHSLTDFPSLAENLPILTITDEEEIPKYSMINFVIRDDHVRFIISKSRADKCKLKLSSELLAVALQVI